MSSAGENELIDGLRHGQIMCCYAVEFLLKSQSAIIQLFDSDSLTSCENGLGMERAHCLALPIASTREKKKMLNMHHRVISFAMKCVAERELNSDAAWQWPFRLLALVFES